MKHWVYILSISTKFDQSFFLFNLFSSWEEGMSLMSDSNFMNNIIYYNKNDLSDEQYYALQKYIVNSDLKLQTMKIYSMAALSVCQWIFSVYRYATITRRNQPMKQKLKELEGKLTKVMTFYLFLFHCYFIVRKL